MVSEVLFSSDSTEWATPQSLFDKLNEEFNFECDVAATKENTKCKEHYDKNDNGLEYEWSRMNWCNPPYGKKLTPLWVEKAIYEQAHGNTTVMLLPARTCTKWFHKWIYNKPNVEIRFLKGRIKFVGAKHAAPFPSMIVIFKGVEGVE